MHGSGTIPVQQQQQQQQRQSLCARSPQSRTLHKVRAAAAAEQAPPAAVQADEQVCCLQALACTIKGFAHRCPAYAIQPPPGNTWTLKLRLWGASARKCWQHCTSWLLQSSRSGALTADIMASVIVNTTFRSVSSIPPNATCCSMFMNAIVSPHNKVKHHRQQSCRQSGGRRARPLGTVTHSPYCRPLQTTVPCHATRSTAWQSAVGTTCQHAEVLVCCPAG